MVVVEINIQESDLVLFGRAKQIDITLTTENEDPAIAVREAFDTLDLILKRKLKLMK